MNISTDDFYVLDGRFFFFASSLGKSLSIFADTSLSIVRKKSGGLFFMMNHRTRRVQFFSLFSTFLAQFGPLVNCYLIGCLTKKAPHGISSKNIMQTHHQKNRKIKLNLSLLFVVRHEFHFKHNFFKREMNKRRNEFSTAPRGI